MKKTALIVGMAKSGISSAKLLYRNGYNVIINDMKPVIPGLEEALSGIEYTDKLGEAPETLLDGVDLMIISPVIPIFAPFVRKAQSRGIEVIGEIELGYRYCSRGTHFVCIGGTNGKTTTTALTGEIFKARPNVCSRQHRHSNYRTCIRNAPGRHRCCGNRRSPARKHP